MYFLNLKEYKKYITDGKSGRGFKRKIFDSKTLIDMAHEYGSVAILAHPLRYGLSKTEIRVLFDELVSCGIDGIECYRPDVNAENSLAIKRYCDNNGLIITAGSDFHKDGDSMLREEYCDESVVISMNDAMEQRFNNNGNKAYLNLIPFWNCEGTYYYYSLRKADLSNKLYTIFRNYDLKYKSFNENDIKSLMTRSSNPWTFQPIKFIGKYDFLNNDFDFEREIKQLLENLGINEWIIKRNDMGNLYALLQNTDFEKYMFVISVDEYFLPSSKKYFCKKHNKHYIKVEKFEKGIVQFVDSEFNTIKMVNVNHIIDSFYSNAYRNMYVKLLHLRIDDCAKENKSIIESLDRNINTSDISKNDVLLWRKKMKNDLFNLSSEKCFKFAIKGIYLTIRFKILPYIDYLCYYGNGKEYLESYEHERAILEDIVYFFSYCEKSNSYDKCKIQKLLSRL